MHAVREKREQRARRHARVRARIRGTKERPRLSVCKSNRYLTAQLIDDAAARTLLGMTTRSLKGGAGVGREKARALGVELARAARKQGVSAVVFDRGGYLYTGIVAAFAEGAREGGLVF